MRGAAAGGLGHALANEFELLDELARGRDLTVDDALADIDKLCERGALDAFGGDGGGGGGELFASESVGWGGAYLAREEERSSREDERSEGRARLALSSMALFYSALLCSAMPCSALLCSAGERLARPGC